MVSKKGVIALVIIALVLVTVAVSLRLSNPGNSLTSKGEPQTGAGIGKVSLTINPSNVEDKGINNSGVVSS